MSLKDNFNQAVKELLKRDGLVGENSPKPDPSKREPENKQPSPLAEYASGGKTAESSFPEEQSRPLHSRDMDPFGDFSEDEEPVGRSAQTPLFEGFDYTPKEQEQWQEPRQESRRSEPSQRNYGGYGSGYGGGYGSPRSSSGNDVFRGGRPPETPYYETEETTVISRNTRINGDISSFANVNVEGSVQGDIKLTKNISVSGKVVGNIECNNAVMSGAQMQGSISSKGQVQMDHDSVLLGNIDTQYLDLNGRIKGNVDVGGKAEFKNDAVIVGDITASTISVIDGAVIKGYVNTTFMQESTSNVFPDAISVGEA